MQLKVSNVSKNYTNIKALNNITFTANQGEIVGLLGPNGAGKSTLMKIITGSIVSWEGSIFLDELNLKENLLQVQQQTGYLSENNPLYSELYVLEYLKLVASFYQLEHPPIEEVLNKVGLTNHKNKKINTLSKGYRQRVGLATSLLHNPKLIILDEPTTGLDPNQIEEFRNLLKELKKDKIILFSTHTLSEVEYLCDKIILIKQGEIIANQLISEFKKDESQFIQVEFDYRIEIENLQRLLPFASKVINVHDFVYDIYFEGKEDIRSKIFDFASENQLKIMQLQTKNNNTLEDIFKKLTM